MRRNHWFISPNDWIGLVIWIVRIIPNIGSVGRLYSGFANKFLSIHFRWWHLWHENPNRKKNQSSIDGKKWKRFMDWFVIRIKDLKTDPIMFLSRQTRGTKNVLQPVAFKTFFVHRSSAIALPYPGHFLDYHYRNWSSFLSSASDHRSNNNPIHKAFAFQRQRQTQSIAYVNKYLIKELGVKYTYELLTTRLPSWNTVTAVATLWIDD